MKKPAKRGRKPGVKVGPYKTFSLREMMKELKELKAKVAKLEKVLN
jgi:tagatose-1,6-bisphosphate aldolase non-catalytic subunit AgaZ/GatZ